MTSPLTISLLHQCRSTRCKPTAALYAIVSYTLAPDEQGQYPMVVSSTLGLALDAEGKRGLFHADYERDKADGYPETHLQVYAGC